MQKIVGLENKKFTGTDGTIVEGATIHFTEDLDPRRGQGERADHFFISKAKLEALDFKPAPGMTVEALYNRFGKVATLRLVENDSLVID